METRKLISKGKKNEIDEPTVSWLLCNLPYLEYRYLLERVVWQLQDRGWGYMVVYQSYEGKSLISVNANIFIFFVRRQFKSQPTWNWKKQNIFFSLIICGSFERSEERWKEVIEPDWHTWTNVVFPLPAIPIQITQTDFLSGGGLGGSILPEGSSCGMSEGVEWSGWTPLSSIGSGFLRMDVILGGVIRFVSEL